MAMVDLPSSLTSDACASDDVVVDLVDFWKLILTEDKKNVYNENVFGMTQLIRSIFHVLTAGVSSLILMCKSVIS